MGPTDAKKRHPLSIWEEMLGIYISQIIPGYYYYNGLILPLYPVNPGTYIPRDNPSHYVPLPTKTRLIVQDIYPHNIGPGPNKTCPEQTQSNIFMPTISFLL